MKRVAFWMALGLLSVFIVTPALADSIDYGFTGGTISLSGSTLTTLASGGGVTPTLTSISFQPGGTLVTGTLGTVNLTTGTLASGNVATGATFSAGGAVAIIVNNSAGAFSGSTFTGTFSGPATWTVTTNTIGGTTYYNYSLFGPVSGTLNGNYDTVGALMSLTVTTTTPFSTTAGISSGNANLVVPEPGTLALFGTGMIGLAALIRRKLGV